MQYVHQQPDSASRPPSTGPRSGSGLGARGERQHHHVGDLKNQQQSGQPSSASAWQNAFYQPSSSSSSSSSSHHQSGHLFQGTGYPSNHDPRQHTQLGQHGLGSVPNSAASAGLGGLHGSTSASQYANYIATAGSPGLRVMGNSPGSAMSNMGTFQQQQQQGLQHMQEQQQQSANFALANYTHAASPSPPLLYQQQQPQQQPSPYSHHQRNSSTASLASQQAFAGSSNNGVSNNNNQYSDYSAAQSPAFGYASTSQPGTPFDGQRQQPSYAVQQPPGSGGMRPPISVLTNPGSAGLMNNSANSGIPAFPIAIPNSSSLSSSSLAYLAAGDSSTALDPTSVIYDENSGGYATPSYAGSFADDSSFDDRRSASPYFFASGPQQQQQSSSSALQQNAHQTQSAGNSRPASVAGMHPTLPFLQSPFQTMASQGQTGSIFDAQQQQQQQLPAFGSANELYAFREQQGNLRNEWDENSSVAGHTNNDDGYRSSPANSGIAYDVSGGATNNANDGTIGDVTARQEGLEAAYERMFAPIPSPQLLPRSTLQSTSPPIPARDDTIVAPGSASKKNNLNQPVITLQQSEVAALRGFTASPAQSPGLSGSPAAAATATHSVPQIAKVSPSPRTTSFSGSVSADASPREEDRSRRSSSVQPSLKSPPLPHGIQQSEPKTASLAPLAIPQAPDLTLTTATPTAIPRTATMRQDSTQAALDTVFATFFEKNNADRKDSTDSMPNTELPPASQQALYDMPRAEDLTLKLDPTAFRKPLRQRSKSDTYMTSPITFDPLPGMPTFNFSDASAAGLSTARVGDNEAFNLGNLTAPSGDVGSSLNTSALPSMSGGIDPRALDGSHPPTTTTMATYDTSALLTDDEGDSTGHGGTSSLFGRERLSSAGPSVQGRRRSAASVAPYDSHASTLGGLGGLPNSRLSPGMQDFLLPPSPATRRSRSHSGGAGHRRGARSEDFTASTFTPRTAQFGAGGSSSSGSGNIPVPFLSDSSNLNLNLGHDLPAMPESLHRFNIPPLPNGPGDLGSSNAPFNVGLENTPYPPSTMMDGYPNQHFHPPSQHFLPGGGPMDVHSFDPLAPYGMVGSQHQPGGESDHINSNNTLNPSYMLHPGASHLDVSFGPHNSYANYLPPTANNGSTGYDSGFPGIPPMIYAPLDMGLDGGAGGSSVLIDPSMMPRGRRRSSVHSDASGWSGTSGEVTYESKTTEATKQAARRRRKDPDNAKFMCDYCGETFTRAYNLKGHIRSHEGSKPFVCETCGKGFARRHDLKRHELLHTGVKKYLCQACKTPFVRLDALQRHHKSENGAACVTQIQEMARAEGVSFDKVALEDFEPMSAKGVEL